MPKYRALRTTWLSHECRTVKEGEVFSTDFPKVKNAKGELVDVRISDNLEVVDEKAPVKGGKPGKGDDDLAG